MGQVLQKAHRLVSRFAGTSGKTRSGIARSSPHFFINDRVRFGRIEATIAAFLVPREEFVIRGRAHSHIVVSEARHDSSEIERCLRNEAACRSIRWHYLAQRSDNELVD